MLKKDKNGSPEWVSKLPQMAKQLEVSLYRNARSFEDYTNMSTLKQRLQMIAMEVSRKAKGQGSSSSGSSSSSRYPSNQRTSFGNGARGQQDMPVQRNSHSPYNGMGSNQQMPQQMMQQHPIQPQQQRPRQVNMDQINPMAASKSSSMMGNSNGSYGMSGSSGVSSSRSQTHSSSQRSSSSSGPARNDPEWKIRIRHKQQRLLLLHHSAKCPAEPGSCQVTPHCADMKRLWRHMEGCKDNNCRIPHCFSSRAILSHYRKCKDANCPACGPVRETVRKAQSKSSSRRGSDQMRSSSSQMQPNSHSINHPMNAFNTNMPSSTSSQQGMMSPDPMSGGSSSSYSSQSNPFHQRQSSKSMPPPMPGPSSSQGDRKSVV